MDKNTVLAKVKEGAYHPPMGTAEIPRSSKAWRTLQAECRIEFKRDLFTAFGVRGPRAEKAFEIASRNPNLKDTVEAFEELAEMLRLPEETWIQQEKSR